MKISVVQPGGIAGKLELLWSGADVGDGFPAEKCDRKVMNTALQKSYFKKIKADQHVDKQNNKVENRKRKKSGGNDPNSTNKAERKKRSKLEANSATEAAEGSSVVEEEKKKGKKTDVNLNIPKQPKRKKTKLDEVKSEELLPENVFQLPTEEPVIKPECADLKLNSDLISVPSISQADEQCVDLNVKVEASLPSDPPEVPVPPKPEPVRLPDCGAFQIMRTYVKGEEHPKTPPIVERSNGKTTRY